MKKIRFLTVAILFVFTIYITFIRRLFEMKSGYSFKIFIYLLFNIRIEENV